MAPALLSSTTFRLLPARLSLLAMVLLAAPLAADELRLTDGRVVVGKVVDKGSALEVTTREGVVLVPKDQVADRFDDDKLRERLRERARGAGDTAFAHLNLARDARDYGLGTELWRHLDRTLELLGSQDGQTQTAPLQRRFEDFLAQLEPELLPRRCRTASTASRVHQLLDLLRADTSPSRAAAIEELLVREQNADQDLRTEARRNGSERRRIGALGALQRRNAPGNDRFVLRTAVLDGSAEVRKAAVTLGRRTIDADDVEYMAGGLGHPNPKVRVRTAEAFGDLGHPAAVKQLVLAGPSAGAGLAGGADGPRGHIAFVTQQAYIRDYDVEVAQAAFIADPKIDVLQSGTVLDVQVQGISEVRTIIRTYHHALKKLAQKDPGPDPRAWAAWYEGLAAAAPRSPTTTPR